MECYRRPGGDVKHPPGRSRRGSWGEKSSNKPARQVTSEYVARYRKAQVEGIRKEDQSASGRPEDADVVERADFSLMFDKTLPYYRELLTDADGNFLFFNWGDDPGRPDLSFSVYSAEGAFLAESRLDPGAYDIDIDPRFRRLVFAKTGLMILAPLKADEDMMPVFFRVVPSAGKESAEGR